jgi:hypothetical protein
MAGSSALHDLIPKPVDVAVRKLRDDVEEMRPCTRGRSLRRGVREHRPERTLPARAAAVVIASVISLHGHVLRRRKNAR